MKGYEGTILSVAANSSILLRHFAEKFVEKEKEDEGASKRAPVPMRVQVTTGYERTRRFLEAIGEFCFRKGTEKKRKKNVAKKWDYSAPISRITLQSLRNKTMLNKKVNNFKKKIITHTYSHESKSSPEKKTY